MRIFLYVILLVSSIYANIAQISSLRGHSFVERDGKKIEAMVGLKLQKKDFIITSQDAKVQIIFNDETVITIGKKSEFKIYDYFYKKGSKKPKASFGFLGGTFKSVTGKIGKIAKNRFKLKTRTASIGIRGTTVVGTVTADGDKIACTSGAIVVTSITTGVSVSVPAGKITTIKKGKAPTPAKAYTPTEITKMENETETKSETKTTTTTTITNTIVKEPDTVTTQNEDTIQESIKENIIESKSPESPEIDKKAEADRLAAEKAEADRLAAEQAEADRLAAEKAEADRVQIIVDRIENIDISVPSWSLTDVTETKNSLLAETDTKVQDLVDEKLNTFYENVVTRVESWLGDNTNSNKIDASLDTVKTVVDDTITDDYYEKLYYTYNQVKYDQIAALKMLDILPDNYDSKIQDDLDANALLMKKLKVIKYTKTI